MIIFKRKTGLPDLMLGRQFKTLYLEANILPLLNLLNIHG